MVEVGGQRCTRARTGRGDDAGFSPLRRRSYPRKKKKKKKKEKREGAATKPEKMAEAVYKVATSSRARELIRVIAKDDQSVEKSLYELIEPRERFAELVAAIMERDVFKSTPPAGATYTEEEVEGIFALVMSLLDSMNPSDHDAVTEIVSSSVTNSTTKSSPLLRLKMYVFPTSLPA